MTTKKEKLRGKSSDLLTPKYLSFLLECFDITKIDKGILVWKERPDEHFKSTRGKLIYAKRSLGKTAGSRRGDYVRLTITHPDLGEVDVFMHRLIWLLKHRETPPDLIDHINRVPFDNRPSNLRAATPPENKLNTIKSSSGVGYVEATKDGKFLAVFKPFAENDYQITVDSQFLAKHLVNYLSFLCEPQVTEVTQ